MLGDAIAAVGAAAGAVIGVALYAPSEAFTSLTRGPAEPKPIWQRIMSSALLMALVGWLVGLFYDQSLLIAILSGGLLGLLACAR